MNDDDRATEEETEGGPARAGEVNRFPTMRDILIAVEQPGEVEPWVLDYIKKHPSVGRFVAARMRLREFGGAPGGMNAQGNEAD